MAFLQCKAIWRRFGGGTVCRFGPQCLSILVTVRLRFSIGVGSFLFSDDREFLYILLTIVCIRYTEIVRYYPWSLPELARLPLVAQFVTTIITGVPFAVLCACFL